VRVINDDGEQLGVIDTRDAIKQAKDRELDLVEVSPNADPPVCKIADFGAMKYKQQKLARKQKARQKKVTTKGIRISMNIDEHDFQNKVKHAQKFLGEGHKIKIELILRGRQRQFGNQAKEQFDKFEEALGIPTKEEVKLSFQGNRVSKVIAKE